MVSTVLCALLFPSFRVVDIKVLILSIYIICKKYLKMTSSSLFFIFFLIFLIFLSFLSFLSLIGQNIHRWAI